MNTKNNNSENGGKTSRFWGLAPKLVATSFLCICFLSSQLNVFAKVLTQNDLSKEQANKFSNNYIVKQANTSFHTLETSIILVETEVDDLEEKESNAAKSYDSQLLEFLAQFNSSTALTTNLFLPTAQFLYNHTSVSLFILYHSWKSFLV